jgi:hypothetical protein
MEESTHGQIEVLSEQMPGEPEENNAKPIPIVSAWNKT